MEANRQQTFLSHGTVCTNKYLLGDPFSWSPFLEKGPHKITEGGSLDPHWPISRINPENVALHTQWSLLIIIVQLVISTFGDCLRGNMERESVKHGIELRLQHAFHTIP